MRMPSYYYYHYLPIINLDIVLYMVLKWQCMLLAFSFRICSQAT